MVYILTVSYFLEPEYAVLSHKGQFTNSLWCKAARADYRTHLYFEDEKSMNAYINNFEKVDTHEIEKDCHISFDKWEPKRKVFFDKKEDMFCTFYHITNLERYGMSLSSDYFENGDEVILNQETEKWSKSNKEGVSPQ